MLALSSQRHSQILWPNHRARWRRSRAASGRGACAHRRERRRQEHADEHHRRIAATRSRHDGDPRPTPTLHQIHSTHARTASHSFTRNYLSARTSASPKTFSWASNRRASVGSIATSSSHEPTKCSRLFITQTFVREKRVGDLSVAARQIVEISRAIAAHARIILMDEPTSSLQREDVEHLFTLIRKLSSEGISVIYISHFLEEVRQISDRFTVLRDGRSVATGDISTTTDDELIAKMVGRAQQNLFPVRTPPATGRNDSQRPKSCRATAY